MTATHSSWYHKFKAFGPGILMASAAIGGSHIVASTQAGALYGWQLAIIVILVNIFKYPFFRFGTQYTLERKHSLIEGYEEKGKIYLWVFFWYFDSGNFSKYFKIDIFKQSYSCGDGFND